MQNNIESILQSNSIIPVVTIQNETEIDSIYTKLMKNGIRCIEITLRTDYAFQAIAEFKNRYGNEFKVGVGTVINKVQVDKCIELNVDFMVSPGLTPDLIPGDQINPASSNCEGFNSHSSPSSKVVRALCRLLSDSLMIGPTVVARL